MRAVCTVVVAVVVTAAWALGADAPITDRGWGRVQVGMQIAALRGLGFRLAPGFAQGDGCAYLESPKAPDLRVMVEAGRVVRVETNRARYSTTAGVRVGDTVMKVRDVYSAGAVERPHKYVGDGEYFIVHTSDRKRALLIEIVEGKVVQIRGGLVPPVEYVEGCL
jgi:hypothetical protein